MKRTLSISIIIFVFLLLLSGCATYGDMGVGVSSDGNTTQIPDTTGPVTDDAVTSDGITTPPTEDARDDDTVKFLVLADLHYQRHTYAATLLVLDEVLARAAEEKVDFVVQLGDFCSDFAGSPELYAAYLNNKYGIPVYGVCGNHEMEGKTTTLAAIKEKLCSADVVFAPNNGEETSAYWYADIKDFRLIGLDTNYSYSSTEEKWEHNKTNSSYAPDGNLKANSLGDKQLEWLEKTVADASSNNKKVLVFSHASLAGAWSSWPDHFAARQIFAKYPNTVLFAANGHLHTNHFKVVDNVAYLDVNAVINGLWYGMKEAHYTDEHTYKYLGGYGILDIPLSTLKQAKNTWYFKDPLSAVVTVSTDGSIEIEGRESEWAYGIEPPQSVRKEGTGPKISDAKVNVFK